MRIVQLVQPDEIYNLGAQSHVAVSFESPEYTADVDGIGALRLLDAIRICGLEKKTRFYQASTSELYGKVQEVPQKITTPFYPRSPYAVAKLYAYWITVNYREAYGIFACNGVLFNHGARAPWRAWGAAAQPCCMGVVEILQRESCRHGSLADPAWGLTAPSMYCAVRSCAQLGRQHVLTRPHLSPTLHARPQSRRCAARPLSRARSRAASRA